MRCPQCAHDNAGDMKFCGECGARLALLCSECGARNAPSQKFCGECGARLGTAISTARPPSPQEYTPKHLAERILTSKAALEGERKQVTVLFADLKGSMELLADRDPEEARRILDPVLELLMEAVHRYEGTVNQVMGDGVMALFGAPIAHEDHAIRACYAALRMQETVRAYAENARRSYGVNVRIRVGLNSGEVVVRAIGSDLHMDYTAVGQTTHLAARMEQLADPGTTLLAPATLVLVEAFVHVKPLGAMRVKGLNELVEAYELIGATMTRSRFQAQASRGLTKFVGRATELAQLDEALGLARRAQGQIVAVVGEAGVGKSRLFWEFAHSHRVDGCLVVEAASMSYGKATAYLPVIELLRSYFQIEPRDDARKIREKVTGKLLSLDRALEPALPALLALLDGAVDDEEWTRLEPPQRRLRTLDGVKRLLLRESHVQPVVAVFEDLHWIDAETQAVLEALVESLPTARVLVLVNYRPEYRHEWGGKTYYRQLRINALAAANVEELLGALLGGDVSLDALKRLLIRRTEGNPLFLEEMVRTLVETKALIGDAGAYRLTTALESLQIPPTAQSVLAARIDRLLPEDKRLLQAASVVGKDVPLVLLEAIGDMPNDELRLALARLQAAEFLYETRLFPDVEYAFKHALTHEVAYTSLLLDRRKTLHERTAGAIERIYAGRLNEHYGEIAHHYRRSANTTQAARYLELAGQQSVGLAANADAAGYFAAALDALAASPESPDRLQRELDLQIALGTVLTTTKGWGASEVEAAYGRALELCRHIDDVLRLFPVLYGLWELHEVRAQHQTTRELAERLLVLAKQERDPTLLMKAHHALGETTFLFGEFERARAHLEQGRALYDAEKHRELAFQRGGYDIKIAGGSFLSWTLWLLGYPEQAARVSEEILTWSRELMHPFSAGFALGGAAWLHQFRREKDVTRSLADAWLAVASEHGFDNWSAWAAIARGWAVTSPGGTEAGVTQIRQGLATAQAIGAETMRPVFLGWLADAYRELGQVDEGLATLDDALALVRRTQESCWEAELHRLRGEFLVQRAGASADEAEACFRRAIDVARRQAAKSLELRAATSLCRLLQRQRKRDAAVHMLATIYHWFTEGFETVDLREARALLEDLRS